MHLLDADNGSEMPFHGLGMYQEYVNVSLNARAIYNMDTRRQTTCMVVNPIMVDNSLLTRSAPNFRLFVVFFFFFFFFFNKLWIGKKFTCKVEKLNVKQRRS